MEIAIAITEGMTIAVTEEVVLLEIQAIVVVMKATRKVNMTAKPPKHHKTLLLNM